MTARQEDAQIKKYGCKEQEKRQYKEKTDPEYKSRDDNIRRARDKIFDIAMLSGFTHFVTWTLSSEKIDRTDGDAIKKALHNTLNTLVKRNNLSYLLIPEYHKKTEANGKQAIHMHALIKGCCTKEEMEKRQQMDPYCVLEDSGTVVVPNRKKPVTIEKAYSLGVPRNWQKTVYNMPDWKYGHSTAIEITGKYVQTVKYIVKYINKDGKMIFGKYYYSGGKITRDPPAEYLSTDFYAINAKPFKLGDTSIEIKYADNFGARISATDNSSIIHK